MSPMLSLDSTALSRPEQWRSQGFQSGAGVKGEGTRGMHPLPLGVRGHSPRKNFQITDARR
jgi:hypothetical protein